ncbi:hypothetical protein KR215_000952, partial [Drosophila sulfurigaster]
CIMAHVTFTNLKCISSNLSLVEFQHCRIKAVNRTHKYITIHLQNHMKNINAAMLNIKVLRFNHGYKPFFFNLNFDPCLYLKNPNNPVIHLFLKAVRQSSNLNHSCPYDHDIIVDKLWTGNHETDFLKYLPVPNGEYVVIFTASISNYELISVHTFLQVTA